MIVLAALTASPGAALAVGVLFGLVRGLAVLLGRDITSPAALAAFHRRFTDAGPVVLAAVVACEMLIGVDFAAVLSLWLGLMLALLAGAVALAGRARRPASTATSPL